MGKVRKIFRQTGICRFRCCHILKICFALALINWIIGPAGSLGNDVMVALVLGGMPLSGGPRSKISAGIIGAATITILNSGLTILGLDVEF